MPGPVLSKTTAWTEIKIRLGYRQNQGLKRRRQIRSLRLDRNTPGHGRLKPDSQPMSAKRYTQDQEKNGTKTQTEPRTTPGTGQANDKVRMLDEIYNPTRNESQTQDRPRRQLRQKSRSALATDRINDSAGEQRHTHGRRHYSE